MELVQVKIDGPVALLTLNRPAQLNALNKDLIAQLSSQLDLFRDDPQIRVLVITGAGEKAFVAGADIKEFVHFTPEEGKKLSAEGHQTLFNKIAEYNKPIIAAINGYALGGGLELALAAHIRLAAKEAKMGLPEVTLGLIPGYGGTQRLTAIVGKGIALEMMLSARMIDAERAKSVGLVNEVYEAEHLLPQTLKLASKIAVNSPQAVQKVLEAVLFGTDQSESLAQEVQLFGDCFGTTDFKEGTAAFIEKRKPNF